jgi:hypothetical protein
MADDEKKTLAELPVPRCPNCLKKDPQIAYQVLPINKNGLGIARMFCASCGNILSTQIIALAAFATKNQGALILPTTMH